MNKHARLVASALFAVIILLAVGITRFYMNISQATGNGSETAEISRRLSSDENGNRIFENESGLYGVADSKDKIIVPAEWTELEFAGNGICIASGRIGGKMLTGCVNYEGDIIVPFIYKNITSYSSENFSFYIAEADSDGSCVVYSSDFTPFFMRSWDNFTVRDDCLVLESGENSFSYSYGENSFICSNAELSNDALNCRFTLSIYSRLLLSKLDTLMMEKISETTASYLEYAFTGNSDSDFSSDSFALLFPDEENITSKKLLSIPSIFIYSDKDDSGNLRFTVSLTAETKITYIGDDGESNTLVDTYKANIRFSPSESDVIPVSGGFEKTAPDYPVEEIPPEDEAPDNDAGKKEL